MKKNALIGGLVVLSLLLGSCSRARYALEPSVQTGTASWYGPDFHGKLTSNKEIFNTHDMTAAHKTLPFGSWVMVTNLENGLSVIV
ncbi:MAG TPA: septal ring lytic transglycosylase RlpA family protein, partial [Candidatus Aminicenantes bacterium]|nr:septal ring lytic transglycosylase RlpA family protein [Candidatus Aminicenantes bacterium]